MTRRLFSTGSPFEAEYAYSRAVADGDFVFVAGTTGFDYATMTISDDVAEQARQCFRTIGKTLEQAGSSLADVVRVRYFVTDVKDWPACAAPIREAFDEVRPASTAIVCGLVDPRMRIEIEVTARRKR